MEKITTETVDITKKDATNALTVNATVISHKGCVRGNNEDNFFFDGDFMQDAVVNEGAYIQAQITKDFHIFAICDGMGGLQGGERASSIGVHAISSLNQYIRPENIGKAIDKYADEACKRVYKDSISIGETGREGTTMAMLYLADGKAWIGNVGDSRVYLARGGKLFQLTRDHSAVYAMMLRGEITREQMRKHPQGNVIGAFIGMEASRRPHPYAHQFQTQLCKGDRFMLCSDGLSDLLKHEELQQKVVEGKDPNLVVNHLIWRAMEMGGKDNTTCIVLDVSGPMLKDPTPESLASLPAV